MNSTETTPNSGTTGHAATAVNRDAIIITSILIFVLGLTGNGLIVYGYLRFRQLRTLTNYFVLNLAITDLLLIAGLASWIIKDLLGNPSDRVLAAFMVNIDLLCFSASMLNMTSVSVDRYCAVTCPLRYEQLITRPRAKKATVLIWAYSSIMFGIGVSRFFVDKQDFSDKIFMTTLTIISFVIPAFIMIFAHVSIFRVAWLTKKRSRDILELSSGRSEEIAKRLKLSLNTLIILVPMITAWGIFYTITLLEVHCFTCYNISPTFSVAVGLLPHVAAAIDPAVYILVTRDLRLKLCRVVKGALEDTSSSHVASLKRTNGRTTCSLSSRTTCRRLILKDNLRPRDTSFKHEANSII